DYRPVARDETRQRHSRGRPPEAALPREAEGFPLVEIKGDAINRVHRTGLRRIFDDEVLDLEEQGLSPPQPRVQDFVQGEAEEVGSEHREHEALVRDDWPPDVASI